MSPIGNAPARVNPLRRPVLLALAAATALTAAACGQPPTGTLSTRAGYTIEGTDIPVSVCPEGDDSRLTEEEGALVGAHFALQVDCVASFTEIPEGFQLDYLFGEDDRLFPPEAGHEFTMVQFSPEPSREAPFTAGSDTELVATLAIGDQEWTFDGDVPAPGSVYFAVSEQDAPVTLEIDDTGRTQSLDLRERTREGAIEALYHGSRQTITTDTVENSVDAYLSSGGYEYSLDQWTYVTSFVVDRSVYNEDDGWVAEPDRARLTIDFVWFRESKELQLIWDIDPKSVLKVSGPDGELEPLEVSHEDEAWDDDQVGRYFTLTYDVPADALQFDLDFHPAGKIEWTEHDVKMPVSGDKNHELSVDFG
ncbi:hypothetical protein GCM10027447_24380 [Glycomyces halotolerans]